jgi:hypothetical protein
LRAGAGADSPTAACFRRGTAGGGGGGSGGGSGGGGSGGNLQGKCPKTPIFYVDCYLDSSGNVIGLKYGSTPKGRSGSIGVTGAAGTSDARGRRRVDNSVTLGPLIGGVTQVTAVRNGNSTASMAFISFEDPQSPAVCGTGPAGPKPDTRQLYWGVTQFKRGDMVIAALRGSILSLSAPCWVRWQGARRAAPSGIWESGAAGNPARTPYRFCEHADSFEREPGKSSALSTLPPSRWAPRQRQPQRPDVHPAAGPARAPASKPRAQAETFAQAVAVAAASVSGVPPAAAPGEDPQIK